MQPAVLGALIALATSAAGLFLAARTGQLRGLLKSPPQPALNRSDPLVAELCMDVRALDSLPVASTADRLIWTAQAERLRSKLHTRYARIYDQLPHELEHYLDDVESRANDPGYAQWQRARLTDLLTS